MTVTCVNPQNNSLKCVKVASYAEVKNTSLLSARRELFTSPKLHLMQQEISSQQAGIFWVSPMLDVPA
jgi:hypothetical protein